MKKQLYTFVFIVGLLTAGNSQTDNWVALHPGHQLNYGIAKLIVKKSNIFVFNSNHSTLLRSFNMGDSWETITIPSDSLHHEYNDLMFLNDSVGYLAGYDGSLFSNAAVQSVIKKTTNGGSTWQTINTGIINNSILTHINFFNENMGIAFGTEKMETRRFATVNGGLNWININYSEPAMSQVNYSNFMGGDGIISGVSHYMHIAFTHDQGSTWTTKHFHEHSNPSGIKFFNAQNGILAVDDSIFSTNDGANTFYSIVKFPFSNFIKSFDMIDMQRGFFCTNTSIYYTGDGGSTWKLSYTNPNTQLVSLKIEGNHVFATTCGDDLILKLNISELLLSISKNLSGVNSVSIYPNPANEKITIVTRETENLISAKITDQLGRLILKTDLNESKTIDVGELTRGVYLVEIRTENGIYTNKLIINH